jgi:TolA-binding protein
MQVVNLYPDHQKTPDALYKLGVVHATLAENDTARRFLDRVQREYPDASAAGLARKYAAELP